MAETNANVLICPDKFKGTLDALRAARAIASGWTSVRSGDTVELLPISDGGDGFGALLGRLLRSQRRQCRTVDAAHRPCTTPWWTANRGALAIVESAKTIGLAMLPAGRYHPFELDTFGLGKMLLRVGSSKGIREVLIGIGGSATNDGGFGMARALGWSFLNRRGQEIERWTELDGLTRIESPENRRLSDSIVVAVDVSNPLLGPKGASRVYGPQKGLRRQDFGPAEKCLGRLAQVTGEMLGKDFASRAGAGAAGGLGFGLMAFAGARMAPGFDLFADHARLEERLRRADLVITGEGSIDRSTLMGKGVGLVAARCARLGLPCYGIAGVVTEDARRANLFAGLRGLTELTSREDALGRPSVWLRQAALEMAGILPGR